MGEKSDVLSSFTTSVCEYFCNKCPDKRCSLVKQIKDCKQLDCDILVPLNLDAWRKHVLRVENEHSSDACEVRVFSSPFNDLKLINLHLPVRTENEGGDCERNTDSAIENLIEASKSWTLFIMKCALNIDRLSIYLNRTHTFKTVLNSIISQGTAYGKRPQNSMNVLATTDLSPECDDEEMDLSQFRLQILKTVLENLMVAAGYEVQRASGTSSHLHFHLTTKSMVVAPPGCVKIVCRVVVNAQNGSKESHVLAKDYLRQRSEDRRATSQAKSEEEENTSRKQLISSRGEAAVRVELLYVKPNRTVALCLQSHVPPGMATGKRERGSFFLYNCARIAAIRKKFAKMVAGGVYPPLVPLEEVDFSLLTQQDEWCLLFQHLLVYPSVLEKCIEGIPRGQFLPNTLCQFVGALCDRYSVYYHYVRILKKSRENLMGPMFARLYLLQGIEVVLHNALRILGIEPVSQM